MFTNKFNPSFMSYSCSTCSKIFSYDQQSRIVPHGELTEDVGVDRTIETLSLSGNRRPTKNTKVKIHEESWENVHRIISREKTTIWKTRRNENRVWMTKWNGQQCLYKTEETQISSSWTGLLKPRKIYHHPFSTKGKYEAKRIVLSVLVKLTKKFLSGICRTYRLVLTI